MDASQTRAIGHAIHAATERFIDGERSLAEVLDDVEAWLDREGLDGLDPFPRPGQHLDDYARPRRLELDDVINRLRTLRVRQQGPDAPSE